MGGGNFGKMSRKDLHIPCRRCGRPSYHKINSVCSSCGYGKTSRLRTYNWKKEGKKHR